MFLVTKTKNSLSEAIKAQIDSYSMFVKQINGGTFVVLDKLTTDKVIEAVINRFNDFLSDKTNLGNLVFYDISYKYEDAAKTPTYLKNCLKVFRTKEEIFISFTPNLQSVKDAFIYGAIRTSDTDSNFEANRYFNLGYDFLGDMEEMIKRNVTTLAKDRVTGKSRSRNVETHHITVYATPKDFEYFYFLKRDAKKIAESIRNYFMNKYEELADFASFTEAKLYSEILVVDKSSENSNSLNRYVRKHGIDQSVLDDNWKKHKYVLYASSKYYLTHELTPLANFLAYARPVVIDKVFKAIIDRDKKEMLRLLDSVNY